MQIQFYKYQGTGNDFYYLNNLDGHYDGLTTETIQLAVQPAVWHWCRWPDAAEPHPIMILK
jgi:hypothetical protein